jgi:primosomal protein N' (replication factor Y) (superfamily II helicase)
MQLSEKTLVNISFPLPLEGPYTYIVPDRMVDMVGFGRRVLAPFGKKIRAGFIVGINPENPIDIELKELHDIPNEEPCFDENWWDFITWVSRYYMTPTGLVLKTAIPVGFERRSEPWVKFSKAGKEWLGSLTLPDGQLVLPKPFRSDLVSYKKLVSKIGKRNVLEAFRLGLVEKEERIAAIKLSRLSVGLAQDEPDSNEDLSPNYPGELTSDQALACASIIESINTGGYAPHLLFGVTGSGKTEVYLRSIEQTLQKGMRALTLVPEIALTPQSADRILKRFGRNISLFHSGITDAQRALEWRRIMSGEARVVVATRSGIFTPIPNLGIIIVDEEHDTSYKQEESCPYNARDLALVRAKLQGICVVLGSATPSFETFENATRGKIRRLDLPSRYHGGPLPSVQVVDLKGSGKGRQTSKNFLTQPLLTEIRDSLERNSQVVLFLNRRGFDTFAQCQECGHLFRCPNCDISLIHHKKAQDLRCHLCGFSQTAPPLCPKCKGSKLYFSGIGTQKVEEELIKLFPEVRIERFDKDSTGKKNQLEDILKRFRNREIDVLIGTQMIVKGHDFPGISLVGILFGDASLNFPDFRASEKTFQLLTQVAGRTGRDLDPGKVILQTFVTDHEVIRLSAKHDYEEFFHQESELRRELCYPPYGHLVLIKAQSSNENRTQDKAFKIAQMARALKADIPDVMILGPAPCPRRKMIGKFRWQIMLKSPDRSAVRKMTEALIDQGLLEGSGVQVFLDIDPIELM